MSILVCCAYEQQGSILSSSNGLRDCSLNFLDNIKLQHQALQQISVLVRTPSSILHYSTFSLFRSWIKTSHSVHGEWLTTTANTTIHPVAAILSRFTITSVRKGMTSTAAVTVSTSPNQSDVNQHTETLIKCARELGPDHSP